jgi:hypothetical protein
MLVNDVGENRHTKTYRDITGYNYEAIEYLTPPVAAGFPEISRLDDPVKYIASESHRAYLEDKALEALEAEAAAEEAAEEEEEGGDEEEEEGGDEDYGEEEVDPDVFDPIGIRLE